MIIDDEQQLKLITSDSVYLYPVLLDDRLHKHHNPIIAFIIIDMDTRKSYCIANGHPDGIYNTKDLTFLKGRKVYCYNIAAFEYAGYDTTSYVDLNMLYYLQTNQGYNQEIDGLTQRYTRLYQSCHKINALIPLGKHEETANKILNNIWIKDGVHGLTFYQQDLRLAFHNIEKNGLAVVEKDFDIRFGKNLSSVGSTAYTEYNYYTTTGRPSNRFGGINYAALTKEDDTRSLFISKNAVNGLLLELDFNAYHPRLIASIVDYDFGNNNVYEHLATYYANTPTPTKKQIVEAKEATFRQLYGGIQQQYKHIPFFAKTYNLAMHLWDTMNTVGYIESPISGRRLQLTNFKDINAGVVLNYFIQMYETESNVLILSKIHKLLDGYITKPVLYTYDSILFDVERSELEYLRNTVIPQSIDINKFPIKVSVGNTYNSLVVS